jgi:hypothetical protein
MSRAKALILMLRRPIDQYVGNAFFENLPSQREAVAAQHDPSTGDRAPLRAARSSAHILAEYQANPDENPGSASTRHPAYSRGAPDAGAVIET